MADGTPRNAARIGRVRTRDGFANFEAAIGLGTDNQSSSARYTLTPLTRQRQELEYMYRSSWIVRQVVGVVADDMTRAGVVLRGTEQVDRLVNAMQRLNLWGQTAEAVRWGRLYGGAVAVMMIDGQDMATPLRPETCPRGGFRGLAVYDRWRLQPSNDVVQEPGPHFGKPVAYRINAAQGGAAGGGVGGLTVHHTRCIRLEGDDLPYFQRLSEWGWGMSVVEPFHDRLVAFDSTTLGAAQMVYKAHLRTMKIKNYRKIIAEGGNPNASPQAQNAYGGLIAQLDTVRRYQTLEGLTVMDAEDDFESLQYNFGGLSDMILQMSQQVSGATGIPLVKLFGMSPAGFSTGDTDLRSYYDNIKLKQERDLRHGLGRVLDVLHYSELGERPTDQFGYEFEDLWGLSVSEKATVASTRTNAVLAAHAQDVIPVSAALRELQAIGRDTGTFTHVTDKMVEDAEALEAQPALPPIEGATDPALGLPAPDADAPAPGDEDSLPGEGAEDPGPAPAFLRRVV